MTSKVNFRAALFVVVAAGLRLIAAGPDNDVHDAVRSGDEARVRQLAAAGADLNARDSLGAAPLHDAVWGGRLSMVELLVKLGAQVDIKHQEAGSTPLHYAAIKNEVEIGRLLIEHGANVQAVNGTGDMALHIAASRGYDDFVTLLLDHKAPIEARDRSGSTPLAEAAWKGFRETCGILLDRGAQINAVNPESGATPLNEAASKGFVSAVELLLRRGADPELRDRGGAAPLENAVRFRHGDVVALLLANAKGSGKQLAGGLLDDAVLKGQTDIVSLLVEGGADVNAAGLSGATPLHDAALKGRVEIAKLLIDKGANVNALNRYNATPLHDAALSGNTEIARILIEHGADVNARDGEDGATPLYVAASMGRVEILKLLLARRVDLNACNRAGSSPLHAATQNGFTEAAGLLRDRGAQDLGSK